ncbi:MAG: heme-binding protein [Pseudomonadota bacterium]|nr:MAG: heme-binding protein [Pseudomonadota bacterium]
MQTRKLLFMLATAFFASPSVYAEKDVINTKLMSMELARDIAQRSVEACRADGYQVAVVVVDRGGAPQVVMRDIYAARFTIEIAEKKANAVVLSGVSSAEFRKNRNDISQEMNHVTGIMVLDGGLPIRTAGTLIGAVGVSGAPGGDKDEACAKKALDSVFERLEFAD